ncbi:DUF1287 domain-containing protein [Clostridium sp. DL1XJH146]
MKKIIPIVFLLSIIAISAFFLFFNNSSKWVKYKIDKKLPDITLEEKIEVPKISINSDEDGDGINDMEDILQGARIDAENKPKYKSAYYNGGYPPDNEGVCTDVIWRAFENAGYNLKDLVDEDIANFTDDYPRVEGNPDPNIDFRRVKNLIPFFEKYAESLTTEIIPGDIDNLKEWQGGDIVIFTNPYDHIAIVSDKRTKDGVPYIIHNAGPYTKEEDALISWDEYISDISYHFRWSSF